MIAVVDALQLKIDEVDEAIDAYKEFVIPARKSEPGYVAPGGYILVDRETGKAIAVTFWDRTIDEHKALRSSGKDEHYKEHLKKFQDHLIESTPSAKRSVFLGYYEVCTQG
ncbi:hypothetical protein ACFLVP_01305 [Chloroflexota bacterium]